MKTLALGEVGADVVKLLDAARNDDVVVRLPDGSEFLVIALDDFDYEVARSRGNAKLMSMLEDRAKQQSTVSLQEVKRRLQM